VPETWDVPAPADVAASDGRAALGTSVGNEAVGAGVAVACDDDEVPLTGADVADDACEEGGADALGVAGGDELAAAGAVEAAEDVPLAWLVVALDVAVGAALDAEDDWTEDGEDDVATAGPESVLVVPSGVMVPAVAAGASPPPATVTFPLRPDGSAAVEYSTGMDPVSLTLNVTWLRTEVTLPASDSSVPLSAM
jgi:hypothetical protein